MGEYYRQREMASPKALRQGSALHASSTQRKPVPLEWMEQMRAWKQLKSHQRLKLAGSGGAGRREIWMGLVRPWAFTVHEKES